LGLARPTGVREERMLTMLWLAKKDKPAPSLSSKKEEAKLNRVLSPLFSHIWRARRPGFLLSSFFPWF